MEMDLTLEPSDLRRGVSGFIDKDIVFHNTLTLANTSRTSTQNAISIVYEAQTFFPVLLPRGICSICRKNEY